MLINRVMYKCDVHVRVSSFHSCIQGRLIELNIKKILFFLYYFWSSRMGDYNVGHLFTKLPYTKNCKKKSKQTSAKICWKKKILIQQQRGHKIPNYMENNNLPINSFSLLIDHDDGFFKKYIKVWYVIFTFNSIRACKNF